MRYWLGCLSQGGRYSVSLQSQRPPQNKGCGMLTAFNGVEILFSCAEVKALCYLSAMACTYPLTARRLEQDRQRCASCAPGKSVHFIARMEIFTSVSIAKSGFQESGGMILQMPKFLASGVILRM